MGASFHLSYIVLKGNSGISKNKSTCLWNFVPNSGLLKFGFDETPWNVKFSSTKIDAQSVINSTVFGQLSWQYLPSTVDHKFITVIIKLSTAWFRRAGPFATADSCFFFLADDCKTAYCTRRYPLLERNISLLYCRWMNGISRAPFWGIHWDFFLSVPTVAFLFFFQFLRVSCACMVVLLHFFVFSILLFHIRGCDFSIFLY